MEIATTQFDFIMIVSATICLILYNIARCLQGGISGVPKMDNPPRPPKYLVLPPPPPQIKRKDRCEYCSNLVLPDERRCISCGASNPTYKKADIKDQKFIMDMKIIIPSVPREDRI